MSPRPWARQKSAGRDSLGRVLATAAVATAGTWTALRVLPRHVPGGPGRWERTNHAGRTVSLLEGPAYVIGAAAAATTGGPAAVVAATGAGAFGAYDDLAGDSSSKGLKGHLRALARGELTTGAVKIVGLAATGVAATLAADLASGHSADDVDRSPGVLGAAVDVLVGGAVVAGSANLLNLLDLRPGRALKATLLAGGHLAVRGQRSAAAAAAVGAALGALEPDLKGRTMLGDTGANAAGALLGVAVVERHGRRGRLAALAVLTALTLASEMVSFTKVIESTPGLREIDRWGR